jgi:hypothetical protein
LQKAGAFLWLQRSEDATLNEDGQWSFFSVLEIICFFIAKQELCIYLRRSLETTPNYNTFYFTTLRLSEYALLKQQWQKARLQTNRL